METQLENKNIKDLYEKSIASKYQNDYEFYRWFTNSRLRADFYMNYQTILTHVSKISYSKCLEFGPGPGTWTQVLFRNNPGAHFSLVDISEAMHKQFVMSMREHPNIDYRVQDIKSFRPSSEQLFDMFFSSRALEYLDDKTSVLTHIHSLMASGSRGAIITKNSKFGLLRKSQDNRFQHSGQMSKEQLKELLVETGFTDIEFYPAIIRLPIIDRLTTYFSERLFNKYHKIRLRSGMIEKTNRELSRNIFKMITEVVGLPGVGKTYYCKEISQQKELKLVTDNDVHRKKSPALVYIAEHPIMSSKLLYWTIKYHRGPVALLRHKIFFILLRALAKEQLTGPGVVIDDGILQYILAISDVELDKKVVQSMIRAFNPSDRRVLIIETSEETRQANIENRGRYPRSQFSQAYLERFNEALHENCRRIKKELLKDFNAKVITVD